jgi:hypothetical protein
MATKLRWTEDEVGQDHKELGELTPQAVKAQEILDLYTLGGLKRIAIVQIHTKPVAGLRPVKHSE